MKNKSISGGRLLSYLTLGTALIGFVQVFQAPDPAHALAHALNAAAYLLLGQLLLFRPDQRVLYIAVILVVICGLITCVREPNTGQEAVKVGLLELLTAHLAGLGTALGWARQRESA